MGSTGAGRFSDYSITNTTNSKKGQNTGGDSGTDRCLKAFSCTLEDVAQSTYFTKNGSVPTSTSQLTVILKGRLMAVDNVTGETVGALPTSYNYLAGCMDEGHSYVGVVISSTNTPVPSVVADFSAQ
ncbi:hypothetical protein [Terasakiella pusilla]|uniref:hypothetical protein n=1 Tax=Terasakiella pusilla TaxID=64973 RepID=UPI003AA7DA37